MGLLPIVCHSYTDTSIPHLPRRGYLFLRLCRKFVPKFTRCPKIQQKYIAKSAAPRCIALYTKRRSGRVFPVWKTLWKVLKTTVTARFFYPQRGSFPQNVENFSTQPFGSGGSSSGQCHYSWRKTPTRLREKTKNPADGRRDTENTKIHIKTARCRCSIVRWENQRSITVEVRPMPNTADVIFFQLAQPQMPAAVSPKRRWQAFRALSVRAPNTPSSVPVE